jgi:hypothetical protein
MQAVCRHDRAEGINLEAPPATRIEVGSSPCDHDGLQRNLGLSLPRRTIVAVTTRAAVLAAERRKLDLVLVASKCRSLTGWIGAEPLNVEADRSNGRADCRLPGRVLHGVECRRFAGMVGPKELISNSRRRRPEPARGSVIDDIKDRTNQEHI